MVCSAKGFRHGACAAVAALTLDVTSVAAQSAAEPDFDTVDSYVQFMIDKYDMPGGALVILDEGGVIHEKLFGGWTMGQTVPVASASKLLSATTILRLVDRGEMSLDDTVSTYLPDVEGMPATITLQQALAGTTGQEPRGDEAFANPGYDMAQSVGVILERDQHYEPGVAFMYGSVHLQIAGRMAEIATGKSWHEIFDDEIARPLGLQSTSYGKLAGLDWTKPDVTQVVLEDTGTAKNPRLGAGAQSNAIEYARVLGMLLRGGIYNGEQILKSETVDAMLSDQTEGAFVAVSFWENKSNRYGYGNWMITRPDTGTVYHASDGAFGTIPWVDKRHGIAGLFVTKDNFFEWIPESIEMRDLVAAAMAAATEEPGAAGPQ